MDDLAAMQYFYEIGHARPPSLTGAIAATATTDTVADPHGCTSVVACSPEGKIVHGRNLDFHEKTYRNITAQVSWMKAGRVLFDST
jgi:hypothetical protein